MKEKEWEITKTPQNFGKKKNKFAKNPSIKKNEKEQKLQSLRSLRILIYIDMVGYR